MQTIETFIDQKLDQQARDLELERAAIRVWISTEDTSRLPEYERIIRGAFEEVHGFGVTVDFDRLAKTVEVNLPSGIPLRFDRSNT